jgi:serine hydrolase
MKKAPYNGAQYAVTTIAIALLAPFGVRMPPPQLINRFVHCRANMAAKNDFTKFFCYILDAMLSTLCFTLPGLNDSGPDHWQTRWEDLYGFTRIHQRDWDHPDKEDWVHTINEVTAPFPAGQVVLIGHSLACSAIAHWAERYQRCIRGAFLVAPADVDAPDFPEEATGFGPMPLGALPFPSLVVASGNDPYVRLERASFFAASWKSRFVSAGSLGHINAASAIGDWPEGYALLETIV